MNARPKHLMTVDEFLPWAEAQESGRYELFDGEVVMQAPERAAHWKAKANIWAAFRDAISRAGLTCYAVPDGATVRVSKNTAFEPLAMVYCGEEERVDAIEVPNPVIVVEVLSPNNSAERAALSHRGP
jgi:Uma2 family endonuclease